MQVVTHSGGPVGLGRQHQSLFGFTRKLATAFTFAFAALSLPAWGAGNDFNNDGRADILLRNTSTGENYLYPMNGTSIIAGEGYIRTVAAPWTVAALGDFNGNGTTDILLRNSSTGENYIYFMNGTTIASEGYIRTVPLAWSIAGVADFDGDGKADILLRNTSTGENYLYPMDGLTIKGTEGYIRTVPSPWTIAGLADFNNDGRADMLLRNPNTGENYIYPMNGTTIIAGEGYIRTVPAPWGIAGLGDFNGNGTADILLRNSSTGENYIYFMNGTTIASEGYIRTVPLVWSVASVADFNGDNRVDILLRNTSTGENYLYPMDGTTILGTEGYVRTVPLAWSIVSAFSPVAQPPVEAPEKKAARLLAQTTFGSTREEIIRVAAMTPEAYLNEQFGIAATSHLTTVRNDPNYPLQPWAVMSPSIWKQYFEANDQLRQRVVFALSQILVISQQNNTLLDQACGPAYYLDMLGTHAFGNFRNILKDMTLSPAMGEYLDMKGSAKTDPILNIIPNENFARELLQLFSVGTVMLNIDGSVQMSNGRPIDTYSEATVQEFARALSGWTFAGQNQTQTWRWLYPDVPYPSDAATAAKACTAWSTPMAPWTANYRSSDDTRNITGPAHDQGAKTLLNYTGADSHKRNVPANQTPMQDIDDVVENVFYHPNVGPFIGKQLIQRLVTSNPSAGYVTRVANVFNDNGSGVRGDMRAVVRAILLDQEARGPVAQQATSFGKLREPVLRFTHLHRAFGARMTSGYASIWDLGGSDALGQSPLRAPSVFNFYSPEFSPTGPLSQAVPPLVGPEFGITNSATISGFMDFAKWGIIGGFNQGDADQGKWLRPDYSYYTGISTNPTQLVDALDLLLLSGSMSAQFRTRLIDVATKLTDGNSTTQANERVKTLLWLILNSPEYSIQK
jgi:uncharacterized protein (DUF1800 family)